MTNETRQRIKYYQDILPSMRQKVMAAVSMLIISLIITVTASYAWVTISVNPEVKGMDTTISGNGSLEIALSNPDGDEPAISGKGDSVAAGNLVTAANITWGNIVNLAHESYGLQELVLRPALLNKSNLKVRPLQGAVYGTDGRITSTSDKYMYTTWDGNEFVVPVDSERNYVDAYGVRAIASFKYATSQNSANTYNNMVVAITNAHSEVETYYREAFNDDNLDALSGLMSAYVQGQVNASGYGISSDPSIEVTQYLEAMCNFYSQLYNSMQAQKNVFVNMANLQLYVDASANNKAYTPVDWEYLSNNVKSLDSKYSTGVVSLTGLEQFCKDYNSLVLDYDKLDEYRDNNQLDPTKRYYWDKGGENGYQISNMVNRLMNIGTMSVIIEGEEKLLSDLVSNVSSNLNTLLGLLNTTGNTIISNDGILLRYELLTIDINRLYPSDAEELYVYFDVKYSVVTLENQYLAGKVYTSAGDTPSYYSIDFKDSQVEEFAGSDPVAEDTYGLAVDLWLRSNEDDSIVLLEGATVTDETGTIINYNGVNRVWNTTNDSMLSTNSTTQGNGSCYVFQASTPEDQARSLELLDCFKIAFIGSNGEYYASASLDTTNYYAKNGEVTVPLVVDTNSLVYEEDIDGNISKRYGIVQLEKDVATWITAIVYLDGDKITNEEVLIDGELEGSLNIQFGSSTSLVTKGSTVLEEETRTLEAYVSKSINDIGSTQIRFDNIDENKAYVTIKVDGESDDISSITGTFMRVINSTQGYKTKEIVFEKQEDGTWKSSDSFTEPGTYTLQSVKVNGLNCTLDQACSVEVSGYTVKSLTWTESGTSSVVVTTDRTYETTLNMEINASNMDIPTTATARFLDESGNVVNANMSYDSLKGTWTGTARFLSSGTYTLQYVLLDNGYYSVPNALQLMLNLGVTIDIRTNGSPTSILYKEADENGEPVLNEYTTYLKVNIYNDAGKKLSDLGYDMTMYYSHNGSQMTAQSMDLEWQEDAKFYTTSFIMDKVGTYSFHSLELKDENDNINVLTNTKYAQSFYMYPPDVPSYFSWDGLTWDNNSHEWLNVDENINKFTLEQDVSTTVYLRNASASELQKAEFTYTLNGEEYTITTDLVKASGVTESVTRELEPIPYYDENGELQYSDNYQTDTFTPFTFSIPGTQGGEGEWKLNKIYLSTIYYDENDLKNKDSFILQEDGTRLYCLDVSDENIGGKFSSKTTVDLEYEGETVGDLVELTGDVMEKQVANYRLTFANEMDAIDSVTMEYAYSYNQATHIPGVTVSGFAAENDTTATFEVKPTLQEDGSYLIPIEFTNPGDYAFKSMSIKIGETVYYTDDLVSFKEIVGDGEPKESDILTVGKADNVRYSIYWNVQALNFEVVTPITELDESTDITINGNVVTMTGYYGQQHTADGIILNFTDMPTEIKKETSVVVEYENMTAKPSVYWDSNSYNFGVYGLGINHTSSCNKMVVTTKNNDNIQLEYTYSTGTDSTDGGVTIKVGDSMSIFLVDPSCLSAMTSFKENVEAPTVTLAVDGVADGENIVFGKNADGKVVNYFMDEHSLTGITANILDNSSVPKPITDDNAVVVLTYSYNKDTMEEYGGYTTTEDITTSYPVSMKYNTSRGLYVNVDGTVRTAGEYTFDKLEFTLNGVTYTYTKDGVSYTVPSPATSETTAEKASKKVSLGGIEVYSIKPEVQWSATSPSTDTAFWAFNADNDDNGTITVGSATYLAAKNTISEDGYSAILNISVGTEINVETTSGCDTTTESISASTYYNKANKKLSPGSGQTMDPSKVTAPKISAKLVNGGNHEGGTFTILSGTTTTPVVNGSTGNEIFTFTSGNNISDEVEIGSGSGPTWVLVETIASVGYLGVDCSASTIELYSNNVTYTISLTNPIKLTQIR